MAVNYLKKILTAKAYDVAAETELEFAPSLSVHIGDRVYLKREDDQPVFSFKLRGAYNRMTSLAPAECKHRMITTSASSHTQGVAFDTARMERRTVICIPVTTPQLKIDSVHSRDGDWVDVVLHGESYSDAYNHAAKLQEKHGCIFVHPFGDPEMIAGQGTIAMKILRQHSQPTHAIFCSIGGGGLISGIVAYVKAIRPGVKVIGVQSMGSDAMARSMAAGKRVELKEIGLFADGTAVRLVGRETFRLMRELVDEIITVDTDAICVTLKDVLRDMRGLLEPSGALALAGLRQYAEAHKLKNESLVTVANGASMNFDRLRFTTERTEVGEAHKAVFTVTIPEERGSFKRFCELISWLRNMTGFNYRVTSKDAAHIFVGVQITSHVEGDKITEDFRKHGFPTLDLSNDELAKQHIHYVVGRHSPLAENEHLYRFKFPERPDALMRFLSSTSPNWNISLFHYRNQGADSDNILVGIQIPKNEKREFKAFLTTLGYAYWDESKNPVCSLFL